MRQRQATITSILQIVLLFLFLFWFVFLAISPVSMHADSPGYAHDARYFLHPGYVSERPFLFPLFLRISNSLGIKLSISAFLVNSAAMFFLFWYAGGRRNLFSMRNMLLLVLFFLLPGLQGFSGAQLTESIIPAVEVGIVVGLAEIFFPRRESSIGMILVYAVGVSLLSITLKPWLMYFTMMGGGLLLLAGVLFRPFHFARIPALLLLVAGGITYAASLSYSMSKSSWATNMVLLLCSDNHRSDDLRARLQQEKDQNGHKAVLLREAAADIDLINNEYQGDPFKASQPRLKLLRFGDRSYQPGIKEVFKLTYFSTFRDVAGLIGLSIVRYWKELRLGWNCLEHNAPEYGPGLPWFNPVSRVCVVLLVAGAIFGVIRRKKHLAWSENLPLLIFSGCLFISGVVFGLMLCLGGGTEWFRTAEPAFVFQLLTISFFISALQRTDEQDPERTY